MGTWDGVKSTHLHHGLNIPKINQRSNRLKKEQRNQRPHPFSRFFLASILPQLDHRIGPSDKVKDQDYRIHPKKGIPGTPLHKKVNRNQKHHHYRRNAQQDSGLIFHEYKISKMKFSKNAKEGLFHFVTSSRKDTTTVWLCAVSRSACFLKFCCVPFFVFRSNLH